MKNVQTMVCVLRELLGSFGLLGSNLTSGKVPVKLYTCAQVCFFVLLHCCPGTVRPRGWPAVISEELNNSLGVGFLFLDNNYEA